jgi:hypothetical protein
MCFGQAVDCLMAFRYTQKVSWNAGMLRSIYGSFVATWYDGGFMQWSNFLGGRAIFNIVYREPPPPLSPTARRLRCLSIVLQHSTSRRIPIASVALPPADIARESFSIDQDRRPVVQPPTPSSHRPSASQTIPSFARYRCAKIATNTP